MGVPKFFRYISERYPCLSEFCLEDKIPEFDNLYLDMNGIIHNCSHPDDGNVHFRITEETMFKDIFKYIDKLFYLIKPQKLFFMAVDGVAPRAKMNQQRSRRFRSAKEAEVLEKNAQEKGEKLPDEARFDSNCITPGTEFMVRLQNALKYFVKYKMSTNSLWRKCRIILSGHETPGEGEHKIMEYIRYLKSSTTTYDPNTRHCLYGLDADLIILGLCTHELHFSLLREEVKFGRKSKPTSLEETRFFLLHLGLLREYLELEFYSLTDKIHDFDIEKLIDDWILMGFLVGNDFIPHLPNLHINSNALPILYKTYMNVRPELDGYINECGQLNLKRLEKYFEMLSVSEKEFFEEIFADLKYFQAKRLGGNDDDYLPEAFDVDLDEIKNSVVDDDLAKLMKDSEDFLGEGFSEDFTEEQLIDEEFNAYKKNYYIEKLKYDKVTPEVIEEQTECYITALQWILYYYYRGVPSWEWFYPHHYAPFVSDLKNFKNLKINFDLGKPFLPFQQLLAVLPSASKDLLPKAFRDLMINPDSELIEYYPNDFKTDLNGKKQDWEAIVLIPFIDERKLLKAMDACNDKLTIDEIKRNKHGPMLQYDYSKQSCGSCDSPYTTFKTLYNVYCTEKEIWRDEISSISSSSNLYKINKNLLKNIYFPGFPTMKHLKYTGELRMARIKVFQQPSRNDSMILIPEYKIDETDLNVVAKKYLNKEIYIGWPHLIQAKVIAVSANGIRINIQNENIKQDDRIYELNKKAIIEHHMMRMGIDFQDLTILIHALPSSGTEYVSSAYGKMTLKKIWSKEEIVYPAQGIVTDISVHNTEFIRHKKIEDIFPIDSKIFMLGKTYLGSEGKVLDPQLAYSVGRVKVSLTVLPEPNFNEAKQIQKEIETQYVNSYEAAIILGIQANCLARITGSIFAIEGVRRDNLPENTSKMNIGLQLKFPKNNEELVGYMRKNGNIWLYSPKAINLVEKYYEHFPRIFELLLNCNSKDIYFESDLFPNQVGENRLRELIAWLKSQDHQKAEKVPCGTKIMEKEAVESIIIATEDLKNSPVKCVKLQVKPHLILKPGLKIPEIAKDRKRPFQLFDRVVVVKNTYQVPAGYKGTIVAIHPLTNQNSVRYEAVKEITYFYDILFDKQLPEGTTLHGLGENRVFKVCENSLLQMCSEQQEIEQQNNDNKLLVNNFNTNENKSSTPIKMNNNNKTNQINNDSSNQLLSAIFRKSLKIDNEDDDDKNVMNVNNRKPSSSPLEQSAAATTATTVKTETVKKESVKNSEFIKSFLKTPPPPPPTFSTSSSSTSYAGIMSKQHQQQLPKPPQPSSALLKNNDTKSFEFISRQNFLNPHSSTSTSSTFFGDNNKKYYQDDHQINKRHERIDRIPSGQFEKSINKSQENNNRQQRDSTEKSHRNVLPPKEMESTICTNTLKQMLGINSSQTSSRQSSNTDRDSKTSVPIKNLPQPPSNWRLEATTNKNINTKSIKLSQNVNNQLPLGLTIGNYMPTTAAAPAIPIPIEMHSKNIPHNFNSRSYTGPMTAPVATTGNTTFYSNNNNHRHQIEIQHDQQRYFNNHYNQRNQTLNQNGPQSSYHMKVSNIDITKGKGAFIPLQALKNVKRHQETQNKTQNHNNSSNSIKHFDHKKDTKSINNSNNVPTFSKDTIVKKPFTGKKYPTPKIAAKFDNEFVSPH